MRRYLNTTCLLAAGLAAAQPGCAKVEDELPVNCASEITDTGAGAGGSAFAFISDPITSSGNPNLSPGSVRLDDHRSAVDLQRLGGRGVLEGAYVDVRNGLGCGGGFGAQDTGNQFTYSHSDARFQEAMTYYMADTYRARLDEAGALLPLEPIKVIAHCMLQDNAYFVRGMNRAGQLVKEVCLGDSTYSPGASYADDATVVVHELQHATTVDTYHPVTELNRFWYDEAGSLNEAISDFMALTFFAPQIPSATDPRLFSRWALGAFIPGHVGSRGAHKCPMYDPSYPNCATYRTDASGFSAATNTVSYAYPDGLGWPYANNFSAPGYLKSAFTEYRGQQEIHNAGMLITGALWDMYEGLKTARGGDAIGAQALSTKLVSRALKLVPKPSSVAQSPVTFREFASAVSVSTSLVGLNTAEADAVNAALTQRGLLGGSSLPADWAAVGPGVTATPGLKILDNPVKLRILLSRMGANPGQVGSQLAVNSKLDPGEVAAVWFDVENVASLTAGGVLLTVTVDDPDLALLDGNTNIGALPPTGGNVSQAQIMYGKVNGSAIVAALASGNTTYHVPTGSTYFLTDPFFAGTELNPTWNTAIWVKAAATAAHGKVVNFRLELTPTNGPSVVRLFPVTIQ